MRRLSRPTIKQLRVLGPVAALAMVAVAVLLISASQHRIVRESSLRVANSGAFLQLFPGKRVCEGPVSAPHAITGVQLTGAATLELSKIKVTVQHPGAHQPLASGSTDVHALGQYVATLDRHVPANTPLRVCVTSTFNTFAVYGAAAAPGVVMTGPHRGLNFSLALVNDDHSLLGALPVVFGRASLFKLSWVGSWTFWVLAGALLACFGIVVLAVGAAARDDEDA